MSKHNTKNPRTRQHPKPAPVASPEEMAAALVAKAKAEAEAKAERERLELYFKMLPKLSHNQLRGELRRTVRRESVKEGNKRIPVAGLTIAFATVLSAVLDNTKTKDNPKGRLNSYPS